MTIRCGVEKYLVCGRLALLPVAAIGLHLAGVCVVHALSDACELASAHPASLRIHAA